MRHSLLTPQQAAEAMQRGQVIACPTEAIFGLSCDPRNETAVRQVLSLKHREESMGLILVGSSFEQFEGWVEPIPEERMQQVSATWPGPVTWLFPKSENTPDYIAGKHPTLAVRVTDHPVCREICEAFGGPMVSTSANPHSAPPAKSSGEVEMYFGNFIGGIVAGALGGRDACSEIRDALSGQVLRAG